MDAVISLLILGIVLSLDNFRLAIALGAFKLSWRRALRIAVVFGLWDGFSPLVGLLIGRYFGEEIGEVADFLGPIVLLVFPPVFTAAVFGAMTALTTFVGLQLGGVVARFIPLRPDLLSGAGLSIMAVVVGVG